MTTPNRFSQSALTRAVRAAQALGLKVARTEVRPDGTILLHHESSEGQPSPYDEWAKRRGENRA